MDKLSDQKVEYIYENWKNSTKRIAMLDIKSIKDWKYIGYRGQEVKV